MNRGGGRWLWLVLLVAVVIVAVLSTSRRRSGPPYDPDSTDSDGARAFVTLLEESGVDVDVTEEVPDAAGADVVFVLEDRMPSQQARAVEAFARDGGQVVIADSSSLLSPATLPWSITSVSGGCDDGSLAGVDELAVGRGARAFDLDDVVAGVACFVEDGSALVVAQPLGDGVVVSVGAPDIFTNEFLDQKDNAVLAVALSGGEGSRLVFVTPAPAAVGSGDQSLMDLIPDPVKALGWQALVVFGFAAWWKGRRLGAPVSEPQPVAIAGSELTRAVGRLLEANDRPDRAAALLRDRARTDMAHRLGLGQDASATLVSAALVRETSLTESEIRIATVAPVTDDQQLLVVARLLSRIREEVLHGTNATTH